MENTLSEDMAKLQAGLQQIQKLLSDPEVVKVTEQITQIQNNVLQNLQPVFEQVAKDILPAMQYLQQNYKNIYDNVQKTLSAAIENAGTVEKYPQIEDNIKLCDKEQLLLTIKSVLWSLSVISLTKPEVAHILPQLMAVLELLMLLIEYKIYSENKLK